MSEDRLIDLGEQGILASIIFPSIARSSTGEEGPGDDCAIIEVPGLAETFLLATADPCPRPLVFDLFEADYWHFGWMTVVINLSDLAAMGGDPAGVLISTVMPNDMPACDYSRFWDGVVDASNAWNCKIFGGNIKDGEKFSAEGMALGWCAKRSVMRRIGSSVGDLVYVVGDMGLFWSAVLHGTKTPDLPLTEAERELARQALTRPVPRVAEGQALAASGLVTACMDASDGVLGSLLELGRRNQLDVQLLESGMRPSSIVQKVASRLDVPPLKLMLSWGDWQLVVTIRKESQAAFEELAESAGTSAALIGEMTTGSGRVLTQVMGQTRQLENLSSERFSTRSYFTRDMTAFIDWFVQAPLLAEEPR
jgi:thiamine-monophosphate kinase